MIDSIVTKKKKKKEIMFFDDAMMQTKYSVFVKIVIADSLMN